MTSTYMASPAKAQSLPCSDGDPISGGCPTPGGSTNLPINSGVIYLLIAGVIVGSVAVQKQKPAIYKA